MLIRLDPKQKATSVLSIPRDLRVEIPGLGSDKINAAYGEGGLDLTTRTVKQLLSTPTRPFRINHAIAVSFKGFREAVNVVHCVYVDVDRRYYHSNLGVPAGQRYAEINVQPGYQPLCGQQALAYVRFRHLDNDIVRSARQQDFLRSADAQLSTSNLLHNLKGLVRAFAKSTSSDANLQTSRGILRLLRLAASTSGRPVVQVGFPHTFVQSAPAVTASTPGVPLAETQGVPPGLGDYVTATPDQIQRAVGRFLHPRVAKAPKRARAAKKQHGHRRPARATAASYGLVTALAAAKSIVRPELARRHFRLPFYAPRWLTRAGHYPASTGVARSPRPTGSSSPRTRPRGSTTASRARPGRIRRSSTARTRPGGSAAAATTCTTTARTSASSPGTPRAAPTGCPTPSAATSPTARCSASPARSRA